MITFCTPRVGLLNLLSIQHFCRDVSAHFGRTKSIYTYIFILHLFFYVMMSKLQTHISSIVFINMLRDHCNLSCISFHDNPRTFSYVKLIQYSPHP